VKVTGKLAALVAVPLVAVVGFAGLAVWTTGGAAVRADGLRRLVDAGSAAGVLAHGLQAERATAVVALTDRSAKATSSYVEATAAGERAAAGWAVARAGLPGLPAVMATIVARIDGQLAALRGLRERVAAGEGAASAVAFAYRIVIADLITFRELVGQAGGAPVEVADRLRAAAALSRATEAVGLGQVAVLRAVGYGPLSRTGVQEITAARTAQDEALLAFDAFATPTWRGLLERSASGPQALAAQELEDQVARTVPGARLRINSATWTEAMAARMTRLAAVESTVDGDIGADVVALRDAQWRAAGYQVAAVAAAVIVALGLAVRLGRPVIRGLRWLRDTARRVAYEDLPVAVARLDHQDALGGLTPEQFADQAPAPIHVRGRDELAEVGAAFNAVHREALRVAAEQALLRVGIAAIFLTLARRGQQLAGRLTAELDTVERDEQDPTRLEQLFRLDHLATLLTRTNDSLLVLGGSAPARPRVQDVPLVTVLRAGQSQIEHYQRIQIGVVDDGVLVRAAVADDVVKLVAELMDNACRYSRQPVQVHAIRLADRVVIQIADQGIGITDDRRHLLNQRLAAPAPLDVTAVRSMGVTVVGHIAARHRIMVELRPAAGYATIAEVVLPATLYTVTSTGAPQLAPPDPGRAGGPPIRPLAPLFQPLTRPAAPPPQPPPPTWPPTRSADETAELPIYEAVRAASAWFDPAVRSVGAEPRLAAEPGWQAAQRAAQPRTGEMTGRGLPVRSPMAQLVPGSVPADAAPPAGYRDPARVGATWAAYARGLAASRSRRTMPSPHTT